MERGASRWLGLVACALLACAGSAQAKECTLAKYGTLSVEMIGERPTTLVKVNGAVTRFAIDTAESFTADHSTMGASQGTKTKAAIENLYVCRPR